MGSVTRVLATTHEVSLKGRNRRWFERRLGDNLRRALAGLPVARVERPSWRVLVTFSEPVAFREVARRLGTVSGLAAIMPVEHVGTTTEEAAAALCARVAGLETDSFAVRCTRSDKRFPKTSVEIERELGARVQAETGWSVDLGNPGLTLHLLLDTNGFWLWLCRVAGTGGLPVGTGGRGLCLLSGGIDSPVAARLMIKRGMHVDFVHFHSVPATDPASIAKVEEIVRLLVRFQGPARLVTVPLLPIQEEIVALCPAEYRVLLYRRFMFRVAARVARRLKARALVTGESLGQVASQTVENLAAVEAVATLPVLRPLIGLDKQEIIAVARRAGSYEISIRPHSDCCSFHAPEHPATSSDRTELATVESVLDVDRLVAETLSAAERCRITDPLDWQAIPPPPGA